MSVGLTVCSLSPDYSELAFLFLEIKNMSIIQGVGINNHRYQAFFNGKMVKEYNLWAAMLARCYSSKVHAKHTTYTGCSVSDNFKYYDYFYEWCQSQIGFNFDGWHLDKDIIIRGNRVYSEDVCVFVPSQINSFFSDCRSVRGDHPTGVNFHKASGKFTARCTVNGKRKNLGLFSTPQAAYDVYKPFKEALCKETANKWRDQIDSRVYNAMMVWTV